MGCGWAVWIGVDGYGVWRVCGGEGEWIGEGEGKGK